MSQWETLRRSEIEQGDIIQVQGSDWRRIHDKRRDGRSGRCPEQHLPRQPIAVANVVAEPADDALGKDIRAGHLANHATYHRAAGGAGVNGMCRLVTEYDEINCQLFASRLVAENSIVLKLLLFFGSASATMIP